jgi:phospholipase/carboxylesterase
MLFFISIKQADLSYGPTMMMNKEDILSCIEVESKQPTAFSIIWLHGLGADGNDFVPIASELTALIQPNIRFIFPNAPVMPVTINNGYKMRAWFDIYTFASDAKIDSDGITQSAAHIEKLIEREVERGIATNHIFLAGFSQGGAIALTTGICYPKPLAGIIALSSYLPKANETLNKASNANRNIPVFIAHGTKDAILPYALGQATSALLTEAGYPVAFHGYSMPHSVCNEEVNDLSQWLKGLMKSEK